MKKKICFVAQFPPPMHGLSKAVDTLYRSPISEEQDFEKIDITNNKRIIHTLNAIRKSKADLFYFTIAQSLGGNIRDLLILKAIGDRPCLIHLHGGYYRKLVDKDMPGWQRKWNYNAIEKLRGAIVLGPSLKYIFEGMISEKKIFTVPNCVDNEYLMSDEVFGEKASTNSHRAVKHVLYLSNFIRTKGYREVLEMAKLESERVRNGEKQRFFFDFAGKFFEREEEEFFFKYIEKNALTDFVSYHGIIGGDKKRELLKVCDVFCLLTSYPKEGQPISILEAMGNGMVIVTTDYAGIPDIASLNNGIIVKSDTFTAEEVFCRLLALTDSDYADIQRINRGKVLKSYTEQHYVNAMRTCMEECLRS